MTDTFGGINALITQSPDPGAQQLLTLDAFEGMMNRIWEIAEPQPHRLIMSFATVKTIEEYPRHHTARVKAQRKYLLSYIRTHQALPADRRIWIRHRKEEA